MPSGHIGFVSFSHNEFHNVGTTPVITVLLTMELLLDHSPTKAYEHGLSIRNIQSNQNSFYTPYVRHVYAILK